MFIMSAITSRSTEMESYLTPDTRLVHHQFFHPQPQPCPGCSLTWTDNINFGKLAVVTNQR